MAVTAPLFSTPGAERWRSFKMGLWLGWLSESNWTDPWLFFIYQVAKPVASALVVFFIFRVVTGGGTGTGQPVLAYLYLGSAFFTYVVGVASGTAWVIMDDREFYRILKYVVLSPVRYFWYMAGRAAARVLIASVAVVIVLAVGILLLRLPVRLDTIRWGVLVPGHLLGLIACFATGLLVAGFLLLIPRKGPSAMEAVSGVIHLLAGVVFPIDLLPAWLRTPACALPYTYWMESVRRGLVGGGLNRTLADLPDGAVLFRLMLTTAVTLTAAVIFWRWAERRVKQLGLIDATHEW